MPGVDSVRVQKPDSREVKHLRMRSAGSSATAVCDVRELSRPTRARKLRRYRLALSLTVFFFFFHTFGGNGKVSPAFEAKLRVSGNTDFKHRQNRRCPAA